MSSKTAIISLFRNNLNQLIKAYGESTEEDLLPFQNSLVIEQGELLLQDETTDIKPVESSFNELEGILSLDNQDSPLYGFNRIYMVVENAPSYIATLLREDNNLTLEQAAESWTLQTKFHLSVRKSQRQRIFLVNHDVLTSGNSRFASLQDGFLLVASKLCDTSPELQKLNGLLEASCMSLHQHPKSQISLEQCLRSLRSERSNLGAFSADNTDLKKSIVSLRDDTILLRKQLDEASNSLKNHVSDKIALEEKLKEENSLLLQQLHVVQESLEQQITQKSENEKKLTDLTAVLKDTQQKLEVTLAKNQSTETLQQKYQIIKEENDLLLLQLHIVQESLEEAYNKRKNLLEQLHPSLKVASEDESLLDDVALIAQSQFFNALWYLDQNPDLELAGLNPAQHYLYIGHLEGKEPSPDFSGTQYYEAHPDVAESKMNPLFHYEKHGKHEGRAISLQQSDSF